MVTKNKDDWINIRVGSEVKKEILKLVDRKKAKDLTSFVIDAINEKLDPAKRSEPLKEAFLALEKDDPVFFRDFLKKYS